MVTADAGAARLGSTWSEEDPDLALRDAYLLSGVGGTAASAVAYFEIDPGKHLGAHVHTAEEVILVLEGEIELTVGHETVRLQRGGMGVAPTMVRHDARSVGDGPARCIGFFPAAAVQSLYEQTLMPQRSRLSGTPPPA